MLSHMKSQWKGEGWIRFKELFEGVFLIQFEKECDKRSVLKGSPWLFSKSLFLLTQVESDTPYNQIQFLTTEFWVHLYGLPYIGFTEEMGRRIGSKIGTVLLVDTKRKTSWKGGTKGLGFMRVRVKADVERKLLRGTFIKFEGGDRQWIQFRYEKLPNFCYCCGKLGHVSKECSECAHMDKNAEQYGDWMRAGSDMKCPWLGSIYEQTGEEQTGAGNTSPGIGTKGALRQLDILVPRQWLHRATGHQLKKERILLMFSHYEGLIFRMEKL